MSKLIIKKQYSPEPRDIYFTVPNLISLLRIISIPFISVLVSRHEMVLALIVLALSAVSDGLDGLIARSFNQVSKIGQILYCRQIIDFLQYSRAWSRWHHSMVDADRRRIARFDHGDSCTGFGAA